MSDQFKVQEVVTFVQQTPSETFRLMDINIADTPVAYNNGKILIVAATVDQKIADQVNTFIMSCATGLTLKVGSAANAAMTNVTFFSYKGAKTDFYVSNPGTEDVTISIATCTV